MLGQQRQVLGTWGVCSSASGRCQLLLRPTSVRLRPTPRRQAPYPGATRMLPVQSAYRSEVAYQKLEPVVATPSPLARATARILMLIPMAAALLGLTPRNSHAAWLTAHAPTPTSESIIHDSTGVPHDWVSSGQKWSHDHFDSVYSYYNTPETLHRPVEPTVVDAETSVAEMSLKEKAAVASSSGKKSASEGVERKGAAAAVAAAPAKAVKASVTTPTVSNKVAEKKQDTNKAVERQQQQQQSSRSQNNANADVASPAVQLSAMAVQAQAYGNNALSSANMFRAAVGEAVLSQVGAMRTAAASVKNIAVPSVAVDGKSTKVETAPKTASKTASKTAKAISVSSKTSTKAASPSVAAASDNGPTTQLLKRAETLRSGLGAAILSQRDALFDAASKVKASSSAALERTAASLPGKDKVEQVQHQAKKKGTTKTAKNTAKAAPSAQLSSSSPSQLLQKAEALRSGLGAAVLSQRDAFMDAASKAKASVGAALERPSTATTHVKAAKGDTSTSASTKGKAQQAAKQVVAQQKTVKQQEEQKKVQVVKTQQVKIQQKIQQKSQQQKSQQQQQQLSSPVWFEGFLSHAGATKHQLRQALVGWKVLQQPATINSQKNIPAGKASFKMKTAQAASISPSSLGATVTATANAAAERLSGAFTWRPTNVGPTGAPATAAATATTGFWRSPTTKEMGKESLKSSTSSSAGTVWGWNPTTVHPMPPRDSRAVSAPIVAPLGTALAPVPVQLMATGLILSVYLLGLARRLATVDKSESGGGLSADNNSSSSSSSNVPGSLSGQVATKTSTISIPVPAAAAALLVDDAAEAADKELFVVRSKEELMADANKRIAAAKEAMAKAAEQKEKEMEEEKEKEKELAATVNAAFQTASVGVSSTSGSSSGAVGGVTALATAKMAVGDFSPKEEVQPQKSRNWWKPEFSPSGIQPPSSASGASLSSPPAPSSSSFAPSPAAAVPRQSAATPLEAFVNALDDRNHATPLIALLSIASAVLSGVAPLLKPSPRASARGPGGELVCAQAPGIGRQMVAGTSWSRHHTASPSPRNTTESKTWEPLDLLLAPAAPLAAFLSASSSSGGASAPSRLNKYDAVLDFIKGLLEGPGVKGDDKYSPVKALLDLAPPRPGAARYDFARNLIRGLAAPESHTTSPFDMVHDLLQAVTIPGGKERFDPVQDLLHAALLVEDWGPQPSRYDPLQGVIGSIATSDWTLEDWAGSSRYCPVSALLSVTPSTATSKFDPLSKISTWAPPVAGSKSKYDLFADLLDAASHAKAPSKPLDGSDIWDPVAAVLDAAAGWTPPVPRKHSAPNNDKYDPVAPALVALAAMNLPSKGDGGARWDPLQWMLAGWGGEWGEPHSSITYDPAQGMRSAEAPRFKSKFDLAQAVLHRDDDDDVPPPVEMYRRAGHGGGSRNVGGGGGGNAAADVDNVEVEVKEEVKEMSYGW